MLARDALAHAVLRVAVEKDLYPVEPEPIFTFSEFIVVLSLGIRKKVGSR
jgi:hypothetical protein